jgi:hypothetical protein
MQDRLTQLEEQCEVLAKQNVEIRAKVKEIDECNIEKVNIGIARAIKTINLLTKSVD